MYSLLKSDWWRANYQKKKTKPCISLMELDVKGDKHLKMLELYLKMVAKPCVRGWFS